MANPEHFAELLKGAEAWRQWRESNLDVRPDLSMSDLSTVNLSASNLAEANLYGTNLSEANLRGASLYRADLRGAFLRWANLSGANLSGASLSRADLREADLSATRLRYTLFADVDLRDVKGLDTCVHDGPSSIGIDTIYKSGGRIPDAFLRGVGIPDNFITYVRSLVGKPIEFYSCFISYSHADKAFARALHDTLQGRGIRCWLDERQLLPGDDIYEHIDLGIRLWDKFLLCCSANSLKPASWVDKEIATVLEKEDELTRQRGVKVHALIPFNLDGYIFSDGWKSGYRAEIRRRLAADFTCWGKDRGEFEREVENVIRALRSDESARENPPQSTL